MVFASALTRAEFQQACEAFICKLHTPHSGNEFIGRNLKGWRWHENSLVPGLGCMARVGCVFRNIPAPCVLDDLFSEELEEEDDSTLPPPQTSREVLTVQQYIVYSPTFQVPAFYFTIHDSDGTPLPLKDIVGTSLFHPHALPKCISTASHGISMPDTNFPLLSQGDHPVLGTPCWYFHPCETSIAVTELLEAAGDEKERTADKALLHWMEAWFLVLCSVVDLR